MSEHRLSSRDAYAAMLRFVEAYRDRTGANSDDIGAFLSDLQLDEDGRPMDEAAWTDWLHAVSGVVGGDSPEARQP
jgi:hypothetical protein